MEKTKECIMRLSDIINYQMGADELTNAQMAKKCGISKRKMEEILYMENKGLRLDTFVKVCENLKIEYSQIFN
ncbi:MAG: helix-turn-helix domain-containing protein [Lachnospiraceae bacterium]